MKLQLVFSLSFAVVSMLVSLGCGDGGPAMTRVTGKVSFAGESVQQGHVVFRSTDGKTVSSAGPIVDGTFDFDSLPGEKTVMITASRPVPGKFDESNPGEKVQITEQYIPEAYNAKSELTVLVPAEDEVFDFDLAAQ